MSSLWLNDNLKRKKFDVLSNDLVSDVCIIGAGIFGLSCGYYLSKAGLNVTIIDKNDVSSKTTGHTTAKITSQHGLIYTYLINNYGEQYAKDYLFVNQKAIENIKKIINNEKINCDFENQSSFIYTIKNSELSKIKEEVKNVNSLGFPANFVTKTGLPFEILGAIQFGNQAQFNPIKYTYSLCDCILKNGGNIFTNTTAIDIKNNNNTFITYTPNGKIKSKYVIIATHYPFINFPGMYFLKMYQDISYVIAVDTKKTLFNGMYISSSGPTYSFRNSFYNGKRILLLGGLNHRTGISSSPKNSYTKLEEYAKQLYPKCEILFKWSTVDCITLDKIPYIGFYSNLIDNLYIGTGFNKWGMTTSNVAANIITDSILGKFNKYAYIFDSTRVHPIKNRIEMKNMLVESVNSLFVKKIKNSKKSFKDIPIDSGGIIEIENEKVGIYRDSSGKIFAVKPVCTHLGCLLSWNDTDKTWDCPCHGSRFDYMGRNIYNPAFKNLDFFDINN